MVCHHSFPPPPLGEGETNGVTGLTSPMPASHLTPPFDRVKEGIGGDDGWPAAFFFPITWDFKNDFSNPQIQSIRESHREADRDSS